MAMVYGFEGEADHVDRSRVADSLSDGEGNDSIYKSFLHWPLA
jgi:hypothetical protein